MRAVARTRPADLPRSQAARHSEHRRQRRSTRWRRSQPAILTVHAAGGQRDAGRGEGRGAGGHQDRRRDRADQPRPRRPRRAGVAGSPADQVARLAATGARSGVDGIVCSGRGGRAPRKPRGPMASSWCPACARQAATSGTRSAWSRPPRRSTMARRCSSSAARSPARRIPRQAIREIAAKLPTEQQARI